MKLIVMACSDTKHPDPAPMPAMERYRGPMWTTLRARLQDHPHAAEAIETGELRVWVLSARFGFIPASLRIPSYNTLLSCRIAADILSNPSYDAAQFCTASRSAEETLLVGSSLYRGTMRRAAGMDGGDVLHVTETDGPGIGHHRATIGRWIAHHYSRRATPDAERGGEL